MSPGTVLVPEPPAPNTKNINHTLVAEITISEGGAEGVLLSWIVDEEGKVGAGGTVTLRVGEKVIGEGRFER